MEASSECPSCSHDFSEDSEECSHCPIYRRICEYYSRSNLTLEKISDLSPRAFTSTKSTKNKRLRMLYYKIAPSVVAVSSFRDFERKLDCSGIIIEWDAIEKQATILTSAKLLRIPEYEACDGRKSHIIVRLAHRELLVGLPDYVDHYHNILTLKVKATTPLPAVDLRLTQSTVLHHGMNVIALGRDFYTCELSDDQGVLFLEHPYFGCDELLRSTCFVSPVSEGGPMISDDGFVVGIDLLDNYKFGHTLPTSVIIAGLDLWKMYRRVLQPWFGLSGVDSDQLPHDLWEQYNETPDIQFVVVRKVFEGSIAHQNGVRSGDLIRSCNGIKIESLEQFSRVLLERSHDLARGSHENFMVVIKPCGTGRSASDITVEADNLNVSDKKFCCCWPSIHAQWNKKIGSDENSWKPSPYPFERLPSPDWLPPRCS